MYPMDVLQFQVIEWRFWVCLIFDLTSWIKKAWVCTSKWLLSILCLQPKWGQTMFYAEKILETYNENPFLVFVMFYVVKYILCTQNVLVSNNLRFMKCHTKPVSYGCQEIERSCWVCLICDTTLWIRTGMSLHE